MSKFVIRCAVPGSILFLPLLLFAADGGVFFSAPSPQANKVIGNPIVVTGWVDSARLNVTPWGDEPTWWVDRPKVLLKLQNNASPSYDISEKLVDVSFPDPDSEEGTFSSTITASQAPQGYTGPYTISGTPQNDDSSYAYKLTGEVRISIVSPNPPTPPTPPTPPPGN